MSSHRWRNQLDGACEAWVWAREKPTRRVELALESLNTIFSDDVMLHTQVGWNSRDSSCIRRATVLEGSRSRV